MLYRLLRLLARILSSLQTRLFVSGQDSLPAHGPVLLVSNHLGMTDPFVVALPLRRPVRILAKAELFERPLLGWLARQAGVIPVHRGAADRKALRQVGRLLAAKECVLIFPEGKYHDPPELPGMLHVKSGAAWLALRTGAPVVPVAIWGTESVWEPSRGWRPWSRPEVHVVFGEPYYPQPVPRLPAKVSLNLTAREMAERIADLLPPAYHGVYAHQLTTERQLR